MKQLLQELKSIQAQLKEISLFDRLNGKRDEFKRLSARENQIMKKLSKL